MTRKNSRCRLVCAFILTRIDYCNALYAELPDSTLAPLQRVLHAAIRFVVGLRARDHVTGALIELHWLPVGYAIVLRTNCVPSCMEWYMVTLRSTYLTWWCVCLSLPADLICAQRTRVLTTRREYARRLVPDRFRLPPRTHGTNYLQTFARSPPFRLLNNTSRHIFSTLLTFINFLWA